MIKVKLTRLVDVLEEYNFKILSPISETSSVNEKNNINILFMTKNLKTEASISIRINKVDYGITYDVIFESICNDVDVQDEDFDDILLEINDISKILIHHIGNKFQEDDAKIIEIDSIITNTDINQVDYDLLEKKLLELNKNVELGEINYSNYCENLILLGSNGKKAAEVLKRLQIANYERSRGGYLLEFNSEKITMSNDSIKSFKELLSGSGVSVFSTILEFIHHLW